MEIGIVEKATARGTDLPLVSGLVEVRMAVGGTVLARVFWALSAQEQAAFFNFLGTLDCLAFQLHEVARTPGLNVHGRVAMQTIGEHCSES
jgi:hypothetical protein